MTDVDAGTRYLGNRLRDAEEQVRFFKAAYGMEEGTPQDIIAASIEVMSILTRVDGLAAGRDVPPAARRVFRHIVAQGTRAERAEKRAEKLHGALVNVSQVVANALANAALPGTPAPPAWLLALGSNLDMVLADAAIERR